jgi:hypothetical protein
MQKRCKIYASEGMLTLQELRCFRRLQRRTAAAIRPLFPQDAVQVPAEDQLIDHGTLAVINPTPRSGSAGLVHVELYNANETIGRHRQRILQRLATEKVTIWSFDNVDRIVTVWKPIGGFHCFEKDEIIRYAEWPRSVRLTPNMLSDVFPIKYRRVEPPGFSKCSISKRLIGRESYPKGK